MTSRLRSLTLSTTEQTTGNLLRLLLFVYICKTPYTKNSKDTSCVAMVSLTLFLALTFSIHVLGDKATGVFIPPVDTYLLPSPFQGYEAVDTNSSTNFVNTVTTNTSLNTLFSAAKNVIYYAFDEEFYTILGSKTPDIQLIATRPLLFAYEAGAWDYDLNQV